MNEIPDAYKEALLHAVKQKTTWDEQLEKWNEKKKESKNLLVTRTSFFEPHNFNIKEKP